MESKYFLKSLKSDKDEWPYIGTGLAISPDGKFFVTATRTQLRKWDLLNRTWKVLKSGSPPQSVAISPNSKLICTGSENLIILLDLAGNVIRTFEGHTRSVSSFAFSPDGLKICSGSYTGVMKLWDLENGTCLSTFNVGPCMNRGDSINSVAFSPDGKTICTGSVGSVLWNTFTGELIRNLTPRAMRGAFIFVAFSPDGKMICSNSGDLYEVQVYKTETGELIKEFTGHTRIVKCVAFSPDGKWICSGSDDKTVRLWSLIGEDPIVLTGHKRGISCVAFSPKKDIILSGSSDGEIIMWANPEVTQSDRTAPIFSQLGIDLMKPTGDTRSDPLAGNLQRLPPELRSLIAGYLPLKDII